LNGTLLFHGTFQCTSPSRIWSFSLLSRPTYPFVPREMSGSFPYCGGLFSPRNPPPTLVPAFPRIRAGWFLFPPPAWEYRELLRCPSFVASPYFSECRLLPPRMVYAPLSASRHADCLSLRHTFLPLDERGASLLPNLLEPPSSEGPTLLPTLLDNSLRLLLADTSSPFASIRQDPPEHSGLLGILRPW